jgi:ribosomal protein S18 acetylase RimI-like enzyme
MAAEQVIIREIRPEDDAQLAELIKQVMTEIGASGEGYSINDPEVLAMSQNYVGPRAGFLVLVRGDEVLGGGGFAQLIDAPDTVCELRKMYFYPSARGLGKAQEMLSEIIARAKAAGYTKMYLETIPSAEKAISLYERNGFTKIPGPQGNTGHCSCDTFYERSL